MSLNVAALIEDRILTKAEKLQYGATEKAKAHTDKIKTNLGSLDLQLPLKPACVEHRTVPGCE